MPYADPEKARASNRARQTPTYISSASMKSRCTNPNVPNYRHYGARGITVCGRWDSYANFVEDMGPRTVGTTLDRVNADGNYEKTNCRWADRLTQRHNRSVTKSATSERTIAS